MKRFLPFLLISLFGWGCNDDNGGDKTGGGFDRSGHGVFIGNEGIYGNSNASLSYYDPASGVVENNIYYRANEATIGDVLQSMNIIDGKLFVVMNNSGKIVILDPVTFLQIGKITDLQLPRTIEAVSTDKLYVTHLYSSDITVIDRKNYSVLKTIKVSAEEIAENSPAVQGANYTYTCSWSYDDKVYRINTDTDTADAFLTVVVQPNSMVTDKSGKLWVLSDGGLYPESPSGYEEGGLTRIDPASFSIDFELRFDEVTASPSRLSINKAGDRIYYINSNWSADAVSARGVYAMDITATALPSMPVIAEPAGATFYGIGIDPSNSEIYVSNAIDYSQKGIVYRYSSDGTKLVNEFHTDLIPSWFTFID